MSVKKLAAQKKQAEKVLAELNQQIVDSMKPELQQIVDLLLAHKDVASKSEEIKQLVGDAVKAVYGDDVTIAPKQQRAGQAVGYKSLGFDWERLVKAMKSAGVTSGAKSLSKKELEKLYYGHEGCRFEHNKWSDKENKAIWLKHDNAAPKYRRYWINAKRSKK